MAANNSGTRVLSSDWSGLSPHLIASFFPVQRVSEGQLVRWERVPYSLEVQAPITEGTLEQTANWTSPFENQTADAKISTFSSMLQSASFGAILNSLTQFSEKNGLPQAGLDRAAAQAASLEGATAVTKLNSTQIFSGMPPLKVSLTAHFRALTDPTVEVQQPMDQLMRWALPKKLAQQGVVANALAGKELGWRTLYPSDAPQIIGMKYRDMLVMPLVIESEPQPLTGPTDKAGRLISAQVTMTLGSLTALDKDDWSAMRSRH